MATEIVLDGPGVGFFGGPGKCIIGICIMRPLTRSRTDLVRSRPGGSRICHRHSNFCGPPDPGFLRPLRFDQTCAVQRHCGRFAQGQVGQIEILRGYSDSYNALDSMLHGLLGVTRVDS